MPFGERLKREREMRGVTLDEIANATKIGTRSLRALEEEDFNKLPGGIFNKGFVRAYARYLGIDEDQAVADYLVATGEPARNDSLEPEQIKRLEENWKPPKSERSESSGSPGAFVAGVLVLLLLVAAGVTAWHYRSQVFARYQQWKEGRHPQQQLQPAPVAQPPMPGLPLSTSAPDSAVPATAQSTPAGTVAVPQSAAATSPPAAPQTAVAHPGEFVVLVRARQDSWVEIVADGKTVLTGTLMASSDRSVRAREKVVLTAGNAGGLEILFNGEPQPPLGFEKQVRTVTFTSAGLQQ
ncbi:MAG: helix-turn-helix domain-containing protein [Terriglobales bacterium]